MFPRWFLPEIMRLLFSGRVPMQRLKRSRHWWIRRKGTRMYTFIKLLSRPLGVLEPVWLRLNRANNGDSCLWYTSVSGTSNSRYIFWNTDGFLRRSAFLPQMNASGLGMIGPFDVSCVGRGRPGSSWRSSSSLWIFGALWVSSGLSMLQIG